MAAQPPVRGRHGASTRGRHVAATDGRLRRVLGVVLLSAVLPGTGHLATGHRRTGWAILAGFVLLLAAGGVALAVWWTSPETLASYAVRPDYLTALRWGVVGVGAAWVTVIISAALLAHPGRSGTAGRIVAVAVTSALCLAVAVPTFTVSRYADTTRDVVQGVFGQPPDIKGAAASEAFKDKAFADGRVNVLLVGADSGANRTGLRSDTMILASVEVDTGRTVLFSLPRNMQRAPFPAGSPMAEQWPDGFDCGDVCLLNAVYEWAAERPGLFPGDRDPGMTALRGAVGEILGLSVEYHVVVDLGGFRSLIDALGGITLRVERRIPIGGGTSPISGYIEPGLQRLDGYHALWYARSRADSDDYQRISRQRCVMGAIARQANPTNVLRNYQKVAATTKDVVTTDIPQTVLPDLVRLAFRVKNKPIESLAFTPPLIPNTADPDFALIRRLVREAIADSEAGRSGAGSGPGAATGTPTPTPSGTATGGAGSTGGGPASDPERAVSLDEVCSYS